MSFTWISRDLSGFSTGTTGIEIGLSLTAIVSGLKFGGVTVDNEQLQWVTGIARTMSGSVTLDSVSGDMIWNSDNLQWEGTFSISDPDDDELYTTGFVDWEWNSGATAVPTGIKLQSGIETFANAAGASWARLSSTVGGSVNADQEHTHTGLVSPGFTGLSDLGDVAVDAVLNYTASKVLKADGDSYEEDYLDIVDIPKLADWSGDYVSLSGDFSEVSGAEAIEYMTDLADIDENLSGVILSLQQTGTTFGAGLSTGELYFDEASESVYRWNQDVIAWVELGGGGNGGFGDVIDWGISGDVRDVSGDFAAVSGDFSALSGDYITFSGDFVVFSGDLVIFSGYFKEFSGDFNDFSGDFVEVSGELDTVSGDYINFSGDYAALSGGMAAMSGDYVITSGDYVVTSGDYVATSGDYFLLSGDYASFSGAMAGLGFEDVSGDAATALQNIVEDLTPQMGGDLDTNEHNIVLDDSLGSNQRANGMIYTGIIDVNSEGFGGLLFLDSDGNYIDADASSGVEAVPCTAMALGTTTAQPVLMYGFVRDDAWEWTPGAMLYVQTGAGVITEDRPTDTSGYVQVVGHAITADIAFFNPDKAYVKVA